MPATQIDIPENYSTPISSSIGEDKQKKVTISRRRSDPVPLHTDHNTG
jgi:hypothetical protein